MNLACAKNGELHPEMNSSFYDTVRLFANNGQTSFVGHSNRNNKHSNSSNDSTISCLTKLTGETHHKVTVSEAGEQFVVGDRKTPGAHVRMKLLPASFQPSDNDVLCGRGRGCKMWKGNIYYRNLVESKLSEYSVAKTKLDKGHILRAIVDEIRQRSPYGGFVKQDSETGRWYEVGDFLAKEKTSQCFRDALHGQYSSSAQSKYSRRRAAEASKAGKGQQRKSTPSPTSSSSSPTSPRTFPSSSSDDVSSVPSTAQVMPTQSQQKKQQQQQAENARVMASSMQAPTTMSSTIKPQKTFQQPQHMQSLQQQQFHLQARHQQQQFHHHQQQQQQQVYPHQQQHLLNFFQQLTQGRSPAGMLTPTAPAFAPHPMVAGPPRPGLFPSQVPTTRTTATINSCLHSNNNNNVSPTATSIAMPVIAPSTFVSTTGQPSGAMLSTEKEVYVCSLQVAQRNAHESLSDATRRILTTMEQIICMQRIDLFVLPELSPMGWSDDTWNRYLPVTPAIQQLYQQIDQAFASQARKLKTYICYGTIGWDNTVDEKNNKNSVTSVNSENVCLCLRQVVLDREGNRVTTYDKPIPRGSSILTASPAAFASQSSFKSFAIDVKRDDGSVEDTFRFGLCYDTDLFSADHCQRLVREHLVDVLLQPVALSSAGSTSSGSSTTASSSTSNSPLSSAFMKSTWKSFRETRAVENAVFLVGSNYAGEEFGQSAIIPPWIDDQHEPLVLGTGEGYLIGRIQRSLLQGQQQQRLLQGVRSRMHSC